MHRTASATAAVRPVTLPMIPAGNTQPLTFHRVLDPVDVGHPLPLGGIVTPASVDEMREILDVLNAADGSDRAAAAAHEAAEKRRKHREAMVLFRLRKKNNFGDMRKQEQSLQVVLQHKLREYRALRDRRVAAVGPTTNKHDDAKLRKLQDEFADVLTMKESLLRENRAMEGVISELTKFQKLVMDETERQALEADSDETAPAVQDAASPQSADVPMGPQGQWVQLLADEPPVLYIPEPEASCAALERLSFERSKQLHSSFINKQFDITETFCLGWRAQHSLGWSPDHKSRVLRFRFTRLVPRWFLALDDYRRLAWNAVKTPELNVRFYSTPVKMKVVQWCNDDTFITFRNSPLRDRSMHFRYFASNCQVDYRDEHERRTYMIHHTILDRKPPVQATPSETPIVWIKEGAQCMKFTEMEDRDAIEIDHCGYMNCVNEEQARYLMIETCSILMRWEQLVVPPRLLTSD